MCTYVFEENEVMDLRGTKRIGNTRKKKPEKLYNYNLIRENFINWGLGVFMIDFSCQHDTT